mmetsp:Transcript_114612/g.208511  ORF Transcript_114612/g.208511 Transcript_114612/m.208511 type:complete len:235 (+) Transcript_114612:2717-3421(+)
MRPEKLGFSRPSAISTNSSISGSSTASPPCPGPSAARCIQNFGVTEIPGRLSVPMVTPASRVLESKAVKGCQLRTPSTPSIVKVSKPTEIFRREAPDCMAMSTSASFLLPGTTTRPVLFRAQSTALLRALEPMRSSITHLAQRRASTSLQSTLPGGAEELTNAESNLVSAIGDVLAGASVGTSSRFKVWIACVRFCLAKVVTSAHTVLVTPFWITPTSVATSKLRILCSIFLPK